MPTPERLSPAAYSRLQWRCRRGLLENDLFIARYFARYGDTLTTKDADGMAELMDLSDNSLLDLLLGRVAAKEAHDLSPAAVQVLYAMQQA